LSNGVWTEDAPDGLVVVLEQDDDVRGMPGHCCLSMNGVCRNLQVSEVVDVGHGWWGF
jgi:hypothetical protein